MTLLEFIHFIAPDPTPIGDLATDIINDPKFPSEQSEEEMISYLRTQTMGSEIDQVVTGMLNEYLSKSAEDRKKAPLQ
jgi:hypothetical protein